MALAATLVGFGLLVVALITGTLWLAVACIVICVIGGVFLLADLLGLGDALTIRRSRRAGATDSSVRDPATDESDDPERSAGTAQAHPDPSDTEITTEFPRTPSDGPTVTLDDPDAAWHTDIADSSVHDQVPEHRHSAPDDTGRGADDETATQSPARHGRHESPEPAPEGPRTPRHGGR